MIANSKNDPDATFWEEHRSTCLEGVKRARRYYWTCAALAVACAGMLGIHAAFFARDGSWLSLALGLWFGALTFSFARAVWQWDALRTGWQNLIDKMPEETGDHE